MTISSDLLAVEAIELAQLLREVKDASGHEHDQLGLFTGSGGGSAGPAYQPGSGQGTLYDTRRGAGHAPPEIVARAKELRKKNYLALHNHELPEDAAAMKAINAEMGEDVGEMVQLANDIVRANTTWDADVNIAYNTNANGASVNVTHVKNEERIDGRMFIKPHRDGVSVQGPRGRVLIRSDDDLKTAAAKIHKVNGYKPPQSIKEGREQAETHPVTDAYETGVSTMQESAEQAIRRLLRGGRSATMGASALFSGEELEQIAVAIARGEDVAGLVGSEQGRRETQARIAVEELKEL